MMKLEHLVSAVKKDPKLLIKQMNLQADAVIINQTDFEGQESLQTEYGQISCYHKMERGVGKSRNCAMEYRNKTGDICLFSDEDIVYTDGYADAIIEEFKAHPEADMLLFNVKVCEERRTYWNTDYHRVRWYNYGRYPAYSIAVRNQALEKFSVKYSELFGGGAPYSAGEDSVFLHDCLAKGMKIYASTVCIGREEERPSTWFFGYTEKFFFDRGVLYYFLYGPLKKIFGIRFLITHRKEMCTEISVRKAYQLMKAGMKEAGTL